MTENGKTLVIVESPAKAKTINKILGKDYKVAASVGHIIDLPKTKLGVDIENGFSPKYSVIPGKQKIVKELKQAAKGASDILLATDPDREGEAIAYHIYNQIRKVNPRIQRIEFNAITRPAVQKAIENPRDIDENRVQAQQARRVLDRIVGYQVSPILWKTVYRGLSAGRVQSVALRLICEREVEIENFRPVEYWNVTAHLKTPEAEEFFAKLIKIKDKTLDPRKFRIGSKEEAETHYRNLQNAKYVVSNLTKKKVKKKPPPPFITSTLQQDASRRFRMGTSRIMRIAQQLYEGIDLGPAGNVGLITYMRTDSTRISPEAISGIREYIAGSYGSEYLPAKPNVYRSKKSAQDAHEAIRPAYVSTDYEPRKIKRHLTAEQFKLYELIWSRFLACQMKPAEAEKTTIDITAGNYLFQATGEVITFRGFLQAYRESEENSAGKPEDGADKNIPKKIQKGAVLKLIELLLKQQFTKPAPRYSESTLVKTLDRLGIGRPSTYAQIISTLFKRKYAEREERSIKPTELGRTVNEILVKNFPRLFDVKFTAALEDELDKIEQNETSYLDALGNFYGPFEQTLNDISGKVKEIKSSLQKKSDIVCDLCGRPMVVKWGRNGRFLACSGFPECKNTRPLEEPAPPKESDEVCPKCGSPMLVKRGRFGEFLACSNYPKCKTTMPISTGVPCPEEGCEGTIVQRQSRKGKIFYSCSEYPKCKFALWNRPVARACPSCSFPLLEEKVSRNGDYSLQCPQCKQKVMVEAE